MTAPAGDRSSAGRSRRGRSVLLVALVVALVGQAVVLYAPKEPGTPPFPNADKLVHLGVFLVPTLLALAARLPRRWAVGLLAAHAVVSEVVQATLLVGRDGDVFDVLADLTGVALGALLASRLPGGRAARRASWAESPRW